MAQSTGPTDVSQIAAVIAALADPAIAIDFDEVVRAHNTAATALFPGLRTGESLSLALRDPIVLDPLPRILGGGDAIELEFVRRVPDDRAFALRIAPLATGGALLVFRDLTEARRIERMRVDFVANASHELRTPLAALLGFIETLEGPARNDEMARGKFLSVMREQAQRMRRLVDDLLSLSRIEAKGNLVPTEEVDMRAVIGEVTDMLAPLARDSSVTMARLLPNEPLLVHGDRDELIRVVENLVENAIRHGGQGGRVEIRLERSSLAGRDGVLLEVIDNGPGIAPEHLPRLTERFYRVDTQQSRARGGTGLGLSLVKHIVQRHRGRLDIESRLGEGSAFRVRLPAGA